MTEWRVVSRVFALCVAGVVQWPGTHHLQKEVGMTSKTIHPVPEPDEGECAWCGQETEETSRGYSMYCSRKCNNAMARWRRKND